MDFYSAAPLPSQSKSRFGGRDPAPARGPKQASLERAAQYLRLQASPHTSRATSTMRVSFAVCSSCVRGLPRSPLEKPHWGLSASCSRGQNFAAASIRRLISSLDSSAPDLLVTSPSTTRLP